MKKLQYALLAFAVATFAVNAWVAHQHTRSANADTLHYAVSKGDVKRVQKALSEGVPVDIRDDYVHGTPLVEAARGGHLSVVKLLVEKGANANAADKFGRTPLMCAADRGDTRIAAFLLAHGATINTTDAEGNTLLHTAVTADHPDMTRFLLKHGVQVNTKDHAGRTPLYLAGPKTIPILLASGAVVDSIYVAYQLNDMDKVKAMLAADPKLINAPSPDKWTLIQYASESNRPDIIRFLLKHGAKVNVKDNEGDTPLHNASGEAAALTLIAAGADVNARNKDGATPVHSVARRAGLKALLAMKAKGADLNAKDNDDKAPLHYAAEYDELEVAEALIKAGANVNVIGRACQTPLHYAAIYAKDKKVTALLLENWADPKLEDEAHLTPANRASYSGKKGILQLLQNK